MNKLLITLGVCVSGLLIGLLTQSPDLITFAIGDSKNDTSEPSGAPEESDLKRCDEAKKITVKVLAGRTWGSGILVQRQERSYTVVTNEHVLNGDHYRVQTPDGSIHSAKRLVEFDRSNIDGDDLAVLQFNSKKDYEVASLARNPRLSSGQDVLAAGFPVNPDLLQEGIGSKAVCLWPGGIISLILDKPMQEGYQIGYHIDIAKGMSGGPLLNARGEVIGVNGKHNDPLIFSNPDIYLYKDGTRVQQPLDLMTSSSWAIPIETFVRQAPLSLKLDDQPEENSPMAERTPSTARGPNEQIGSDDEIDNLGMSDQADSTLSETEVKNMAEKITVLVSYSSRSPQGSEDTIIPNGSGVIFAKKGDKYYALTDEYVVPPQTHSRNSKKYYIRSGARQYEVSNIRSAGAKLSLLEFASDESHKLAPEVDATNLGNNAIVYVAGWQGFRLGENPKLTLMEGKITNPGKVDIDKPNDNDRITPQMRGGPVLDQKGNLVGIHKNGKEWISIKEFWVIASQDIQSLRNLQNTSSDNFPQGQNTNGGDSLGSCGDTLWGNCSE